jgi:hypothetical protein
MIKAVLEDPTIIVEEIAQQVSDAKDEKGIAYCTGYTAGLIAQMVLLKKVKGGSGAEANEMSGVNKYCLSGEEHYESLKELFGAGNVEWTTKETITNAERLKLKGWGWPPKDKLYLKYKDIYNDEKYFNQVTGDAIYPIEDGFLNGKYDFSILKENTIIDRYGSNKTGKFFAPVGSSYGSRGLPPFMTEQPYNQYVVIREFEVKSGKIAPWFGEIGGGEQYFTDVKVLDFDGNYVEATIENLEKYEYIKKITP